MPLTRLDNLITSKTGKYLYVSPDDFNASDELNNRGNSPVRPFKSIQRAFLEVARFSYLPGKNNDRFDQFTIMLMPGEHFIDNRPGLVDTSGIGEFGFSQADNEWTDQSILDIGNPNNVLYKFNNTEGGAIIPRGTSLVGYDLRRTMVKPLYVPDPADSREPRSAIFNVTGGCYFWQFTIKDGETTSLSPLYDSTEGIGKVYYSKDDFTKLATPNYSHHKLTVFEYADKQELELLYRKIAKAFAGYQPTIDDAEEFEPRVQENRIVGPLSDSRQLESIKLDDNTSPNFSSLPGSTTRVEVTTKIDHGYFQGQFVAVTNTNIDDILEGTFQIDSIDQNDPRKFVYLVPQTVNSIGTGIVSGDTITATSTPPLGQNAQVLAEVDSVESASPYVFNCSIRSTWGICGIWANGLKATGFKSMVIAQYTGVSLQKDDRAFIRYDEFTNTWNQANLTDAFDSIPYHTKGDSYWKDEWRNFHVRASEDAFIQNVSIFAVGFADHFLMESGGDMSITNSNSNFGNTSLHAIGHKGFSFNSDKGGYIDAIIPPKIIETTDQKINYYPFNVPASQTGVEGVQQLPISGVRTRNDSRIYLDSQDDALDPAKRPAVSIEGYRLGARQNEKIYTTLETAYQGDDGEYEAELAISGYKKYIAKPSILSPSSAPNTDPNFHLKQDAANLITSNKVFIQEEVFGYVLEKYPALQNISYVNPGLDPASNRYQDARNLILSNRSQIVNDAYDSMYAAFGPAGENNAAFIAGNDETKCKRDIGLIVDAIAEDLRDGGNANIIEATKKYFNADGTPLANGLVGEEKFAVFAFNRARELCKQAIANLLLITDNTVTVDPANGVNPSNSLYYTPSAATYNPATGVFTATIGNHTLTTSQKVELSVEGFTFTCAMDNNKTEKSYPRATDPAANTELPIVGVTGTTISVNVGASAADQQWTPSAATYDPATGDFVITLGAGHGLTTGEGIVLADNSFTFTCGMDNDDAQKTYPRPGIDPFAGRSLTITSTTATTVTVNVGASRPNQYFTPSAATYNPVTGDMTVTVGQHGLGVGRSVVLADNSFTFTCALDNNATQHTYPRPGTDPYAGKSIAITNVGQTSHSITDAPYNPSTGVITLTVANHGFSNGDYVKVDDGGLTYTCVLDGNTVQKSYPRAGYDYPSGRWLQISNVTTNTFDINVGPSSYTGAHTFVSATAGALKRQTGEFTINVGTSSDTSAHTFVSAAANAIKHEPQSAHTFVSAAANAVKHLPQSAHTFVRAASNALRVAGTTSGSGSVSDISSGSYKDARNLILANKSNMVSASIAAIQAYNPSFVFPGGSTAKCERDLGLIVDAVAQDLWFGGNEYTIAYVKEYFDGNNLISNGVQGEVPETIVGLNKLQDQMNLAVNNQLANTDNTITLDNTGDPAIVSDSAADAFNLITANKKFIAKEAYERMKVAYPAYTPSTGNTEQDCLDDVYNVMDEILYNVKFGGNHKAFDAANIYVTNVFNGVAVQTFIDSERDEAARVFTEALDVAIDVMRNIAVTPTNWIPSGDELQSTDLTIIIDPNNPTCASVESSLNTLFGIVIQAIGTDAGVGNLNGISRNVPSQPTSYTAGNCSEVLSSIDTLVGLFIDSLYAGNLNDLPAVDSGLWDCANVRASIDNLTDILTDAITAGSLTQLPPVNEGDFITNAQASKCYRDVGYIVDAVVNDLKFGGNINSVQAGEAYYVGNNLTYIDGEKNETLDAWGYVKTLAISAMRNHTTQVNGCNITSGSAVVNVGSNVGLSIGMKVEEYTPSDFLQNNVANGQLNPGATPITTNIPTGTYIKQLIGTDRIELGTENSRLTTGQVQNAQGSNTNASLYFTLEKGQWADTDVSVDSSVLSTGAGYPECAGVASAIDTLVDNIIFIINNGLNSVQRQEPTVTPSDFSSRSTLWTVDITGLGSGDPHQFETGTPVRLIPRPRWDNDASKYVEVDKRLVRLPNGFETNRTYFVIAPGRVTQPFNFAGATEFSGNTSNNKLMLAESKENAAAGIYIFSSEADSIDPDVEIDILQFTLDEKYDLHTYKCTLDPNVNGGIKTNIGHIFDVPYSNVTPQRVFFRAAEGSTLPLLSSTYNSDNAANNGGDSTAGVADSAGRLNPEFEFYVRYVYNPVFPNKVLCVYKTHADAIADVNRINFSTTTAPEFILYGSKKNAPIAFDPRGTAYSNSTTGRWYIKVKDTSSTSNPLSVQQESILWRFQESDFLTSPPPKTDDSFYFRQIDAREPKDRIYRVRYTIPKYLEGVRDPINGFVLKTRTDGLRKLRPQKILLKPAPGTTKTDAFFENTNNSPERIGWTNQQIINAIGDDSNAYDPYRLDLSGQGIDYAKRIVTQQGKVQFTIQSGKLVDIEGQTYLELVVFDFQPDPDISAISNEVFRTVKIGAPQGGLFNTDSTQKTTNNAVTWAGNSSGAGWVQGYFNVGSDHYLILKGDNIDGNLAYSAFTNTRITQGNVYADLLEDPDMGKSLPLKTLIEKNYPEYYYRQNRAPVYTLTPGDTIREDGSDNLYYIDTVEDLGEIEDTFYIFDIDELQRRISGQQDGVYYLTLLRGNISPFPQGAGNQGNFRNFKFSQPISFLYPQNYKNDPFWFKYNGTTANELAYANTFIDPPATSCAADNYIHGLVTTNDSKSSVSREMIADLTETPAFFGNTYTGDNAVKAQEGNASAGAEDRIIPLSGDNRVATQQKFYVELRRPSIARAGNHTFEYLGFGPGNYSTGLPARQEIVLTATQDYYAQAKRQDAGIVFYTGINSNGELYIGNRKINAITGEEEFLEKAQLLDSDDDEDDIGSLVTTFDVPVTFNQNITVNGGDGEKVSAFNSPVLINVDNADLTLQDAPIVIRSRVNNQDPDGSYNDPLLDRSNYNPRDSGDIFLGKNYVRSAVFQFNPRRNGQNYKFQTHTVGTTPSNISPNQSGVYGTPGGTAIDATQRVFYGVGVNGVLPEGGDILFKGDSVQRSGSLGWIFSNYYVAVQDTNINSLQFGGLYVKINWANVGGVQQTNQLLGVNETSSIRIANFFPTPLLDGTFAIVSPSGDPFLLSNSYCHIQLSSTLASIVYNDAQNTQQTVSNPAWAVLTDPAVLGNNNVSVAPTMEFSNATWKELGILGAETFRTATEVIGDYKLGINTVARSAHSAYETAFVDAATDPRANLDVVGTAFISGKTIGDYLDHAAFANRTETAQDNALLVGGNSASPGNEATFRVSTTNGGRVGINVTNLQLNGSANNGLFNQALAVDGNGFISGDLRVETDLAVNGGDLTTTQTTFNLLEATVTTLNFANDATTVNAFNDATGTQTINVGGSTDNQTLNIGTAADTSRLNIHTTSEDSEINIGTVPNTTNTFRSLITIGGAFANAAESRLTVENFQTILKSSILEINNGLTSTTGNENALVELQSNARKIDLFTRNGAGAEINAFTKAVALSIGAIAGQTQINNALRVLGDTTLEGDVTQNGGNNNGAVQVARGVLGTTAIEHNIGDLNSLNVDFYSYVANFTGSLRFTTAAVSNNTLVVDNVLGPANYLVEGNVVRFTDVTGLSGVTVGTLYFAYNVSGQTFQIVPSAGSTTPVTITGTPTDARVTLDGTKIDASGQGGTGTSITSSTTLLPLNNIDGLTVGDLLLIDNEIIRVANPPSVANRTVVVERGIDCTTAATHADNAFVAKLIFTQDATFIREGDQGPSDITLAASATQIELGEFGGTFKPNDYLRLSAGPNCPSGEFVRITAILNAAPERFRINDGANNDRFNVDSVTGNVTSTLVGPQSGSGTEDFQIQLTTSSNRFVIERDTTGNERLTIDRDGKINLIGDGTAANPAATIRSDGSAAFTGNVWVTNTHAEDTSLNNGRLRLVQSSGDLDVAGGIDLDGEFRIYSGSTGINFTGTPVFAVGTDGATTINNDLTINNGGINIGGIDNYITQTGARKWLIIDTPSNTDSSAPTLAANTSYFIKPAGTGVVLVLKLPSSAASGDLIRLVDIAGNLSYNCQLIVRAPSGVNIMGDATGTNLGGLGSAHTGGELIVNTPNVGLGLVYVGSTDAAGVSIGSSDQGWRLVEV